MIDYLHAIYSSVDWLKNWHLAVEQVPLRKMLQDSFLFAQS